MAKAYDIAKRLEEGNQKPVIRLGEAREYQVNTSKSAVLYIKAISDDGEKDEFEKVDEIIKIALGTEAAAFIESQDMPMKNLILIVNAIMAAISGDDLEDAEARTKEKK